MNKNTSSGRILKGLLYMYNEYENCLRCGRKLKTPESKILGFGKVCYEKYNSEAKYKELFHLEMSNNESINGGEIDAQQ